ncbi:uncharacterized protein TNCV_4126251 [Trichonephila clavipes]|nr:uncharacterized protein TNCV_4126251 [Trichonephila clavipes]
MIANYVNEQHDTWDQFLREFAYAIRTAVNETTGKTPAELFLGRKLITSFQKLVMVSDGTEFIVGDIERLFEEARRSTKAKHEKWEKYYNRRRCDVRIKVNDWVLIATHPLSSATRKVVAKFKPKFKGSYRVLDVKNNNVVVWKAGKRLTINVDQVRIYRHRKCDETEIGTGSSDNGSLRDESSGFDRVQRRSNESQDAEPENIPLSFVFYHSSIKYGSASQTDCVPGRIQAIHFWDQPFYFSFLLNIFKALVSEKISKRILCHGNNLNSLHQYVPADILPEELGGNLGPLTPLANDFKNKIMSSEASIEKMNKYGFSEKRIKHFKRQDSKSVFL